MTNSEPWYVTAFQADYSELYSHRDLPSARREVAWLLEHGVAGRTLDLCCGFGRHSLAMAEAGLDVLGLDLSADLLAQSRELPGAERLAGRLVRADARRPPYQSASFTSVVNLFSSFGYFGDDGDAEVLDNIARVLRPGGRLVMDLMNPARIRAGLVPESDRMQAGVRMLESRSLQDDGRRVTKRVRLEHPDGRVDTWHEDVRMYEPAEIAALLDQRHIEVEATYGDFEGSAFGSGSDRQLVLARRN